MLTKELIDSKKQNSKYVNNIESLNKKISDITFDLLNYKEALDETQQSLK